MLICDLYDRFKTDENSFSSRRQSGWCSMVNWTIGEKKESYREADHHRHVNLMNHNQTCTLCKLSNEFGCNLYNKVCSRNHISLIICCRWKSDIVSDWWSVLQESSPQQNYFLRLFLHCISGGDMLCKYWYYLIQWNCGWYHHFCYRGIHDLYLSPSCSSLMENLHLVIIIVCFLPITILCLSRF